jgi:hypothetical protein
MKSSTIRTMAAPQASGRISSRPSGSPKTLSARCFKLKYQSNRNTMFDLVTSACSFFVPDAASECDGTQN